MPLTKDTIDSIQWTVLHYTDGYITMSLQYLGHGHYKKCDPKDTIETSPDNMTGYNGAS